MLEGIEVSLNLNDVTRKEYVSGYFSRNKKIFTLSVVIFLLLCCLGLLMGGSVNVFESYGENLDKVVDNLSLDIEGSLLESPDGKIDLSDYSFEEKPPVYDPAADALFKDYSLEGFMNLFIHNFSIDMSCILGGLLFSIPTIIYTGINAVMFGAMFVEAPFILLLFGVFPHGIFEIPSSLFALAGGLMLSSAELKILKGVLSRRYSVKEKFDESAPLIKDAIISSIIVFVLLFIAAFIETFITPILLYLII